jgi:hypothetical protein
LSRLRLLSALAVLVAATTASAASGPTRAVLFYDAQATQTGSAGPRAAKAGHLESASGILRAYGGRAVGRFSSTCVVLAVRKGVARERCSGSSITADGRLDYTGTRLSTETTQDAILRGTNGSVLGAHGVAVLRGLNDRETLVVATVTPKRDVALRAGLIARPARNAAFRSRADAVCAAAGTKLDALPPFPYSKFDPQHPDPALLPDVGRFLTRSHDVRPIFRTLNRQLRVLGQPPADGAVWRDFVGARAAALVAQEAQDRAALAANVDDFIASVDRTDWAARRAAIAATVFGATGCLL